VLQENEQKTRNKITQDNASNVETALKENQHTKTRPARSRSRQAGGGVLGPNRPSFFGGGGCAGKGADADAGIGTGDSKGLGFHCAQAGN